MQYDFRGSPSTSNGNGHPNTLPHHSYCSSSGMETAPGVVPLQMYQQVAEELESVRQQVSQLSLENQQLRSLHQQLSGEITSISQELQSQLGQTLKRLQQIERAAQAAPCGDSKSQPFQATYPPEPKAPETAPNYDFLNRLKRRQAGSGTSSFLSSNRYSEPYTSNSGCSAPSDPFGRATPSRPENSVPLPGFTRLDSNHPAEPYPRGSYSVPPLHEFIQEMSGTDPYAEASTGVYQRVRDQHHGSQVSIILWIAATVMLVTGSFAFGFIAVQPFLRSDPPPVPAQAP